MKIGFVLFEKWHGRKDIGSSRIRGHNLIKYWPEAEIFKQGKKYDVVIFQKVYWSDYVKLYKGIKIMDICDADFLEGQAIKEMADNVDAIVVTTQKLADYYKMICDKPVYIIPDRHDLNDFNYRKIHKGKAKSVVWWGYYNNSIVLEQTLLKLKKMGLILHVISDSDYHAAGFLKEDQIVNHKWEVDSVNKYITQCDIALLPKIKKGNFAFKSDNKKIQAWGLGMPVAEEPKDLERFLDPEERRKEGHIKRKEVFEKYGVKLSVLDYKNIINDINKQREKLNILS